MRPNLAASGLLAVGVILGAVACDTLQPATPTPVTNIARSRRVLLPLTSTTASAATPAPTLPPTPATTVPAAPAPAPAPAATPTPAPAAPAPTPAAPAPAPAPVATPAPEPEPPQSVDTQACATPNKIRIKVHHPNGPNGWVMDSVALSCGGCTDGRQCCPLGPEGSDRRLRCEDEKVPDGPTWEVRGGRSQEHPTNPWLHFVRPPATVRACIPQACSEWLDVRP